LLLFLHNARIGLNDAKVDVIAGRLLSNNRLDLSSLLRRELLDWRERIIAKS
jgi:hypothetical protein